MELKWEYLDELYREKYFDKDVPQVYLKSEADKVIAYHKYKRCLKNREICVMRCDIEFARQYPTRASFWMKWERKWLELAEKFKEVK